MFGKNTGKERALTAVTAIWCVVCIIASLAVASLRIYLALDGISVLSGLNATLILLAGFAVSGYVLLLTGRQLGLYVVAACMILESAANAFNGAAILIPFSALGPLITGALAKDGWPAFKRVYWRKSAAGGIFVAAALAFAVLILAFAAGNSLKSAPSVYDGGGGRLVVADGDGNIIIDNFGVIKAAVEKDPNDETKRAVAVTLTPEARECVREATLDLSGRENYAERYLGVYLDGTLVAAFPVYEPVDSDSVGVIYGLEYNDAKVIARLINSYKK